MQRIVDVVGGATHDRLLEAGDAELRASGPRALTVRLVARRAGVSAATAYKVFSSKEHLLATVFLRHLGTVDVGALDADTEPLDQRLAAFAGGVATSVGADPTMAGALRTVFLADDLDTARVREMVVADFDRRIAAVLGDELSTEAATTVRLAFAGAMLTAGAGLVAFPDVADLVAAAVRSVRRS